jgi:NAD(P)-dependent dehydrogenase (short-subunit alcohol dehydrogenase family)
LVENHPFIKQRDGLDVLVHNASKYSQIPLEDLTVEDMRVMNRLHVESPLQLTQGLTLCLSSIEGSVVALTDTSEGQHWEKLTHYTASKAGLRQLMLGLAGELAPRVRVNCVGPGAILSADWEQEHFDNVLQRVPLRRSGTPADIASAVFFLANASYITGQELKVDGGWTLSP